MEFLPTSSRNNRCRIVFDNLDGFYLSGDYVKGEVFFKRYTTQHVKDITIYIIGKSYVQLDNTVITKNGSFTKRYASHKEYVKCKQRLMSERVLNSETYILPFKLPLSEGCETSCETEYGRIRYEVTVRVEKPLQRVEEYKKCVSVGRYVDLNTDKNKPAFANLPTRHLLSTSMKSNSWYFCNFNIDFCAFAVGQNITFEIDLRSISPGVDIKYDYSFKKITTYKTKTSTFSRTSYLVNSTNNYIQFPRKVGLQTVSFPIAAVPPTSDRHSLIQHSYELELLILAKNDVEKKINLPIYIGTYPMIQSLTSDESKSLEMLKRYKIKPYLIVPACNAKYDDFSYFHPRYLVFSPTYNAV